MPDRYCVRVAADVGRAEGCLRGRLPTSPRRGNWHAGQWRCPPRSIAKRKGDLLRQRGLWTVEPIQAATAGIAADHVFGVEAAAPQVRGAN
jgi:hypothetical protein